MKNQNDLIIAIVCLVLGLIAVGAFAGTKPQAKAEPAPSPVKVDKPVVAGAEVKMANALPGASGGGGGAAGGGGGGMRMPGGRGGKPLAQNMGAVGGGAAPGGPPPGPARGNVSGTTVGGK